MKENGQLDLKDENSKEFQKTLEFLSGLVQAFIKDIKETELSLSALQIEIGHLLKNFNALTETLKDNQKEIFNNQKEIHNLDLRLQKIELFSENQSERIKELIEYDKHQQEKKEVVEEKIEQQRISLQITDKSGKWGLRIALITGFLALLATIITSIFAHLK